VVFAVVWWIVRSPFGRLIRAMGANETALASGGFNAVYIRVQTFVAGGMLAALSGVLYAGYNGIVQVSDYSYLVSITLLTMVVIGGAGSIVGSLIGAAIVVIVPQQLNNLAVASTISGPLQQLLFGGVLLIVMLFFPAGIADLLQRGFTRIRGLFQPSRQGITANAPAMSPAEKESQP
jgi:branched-chain amino acid transport system permease protein